jgi:hypothetical protein
MKKSEDYAKVYIYGMSVCPICGELVADNWYIRHLKTVHGLKGAVVKEAEGHANRPDSEPTKTGNLG